MRCTIVAAVLAAGLIWLAPPARAADADLLGHWTFDAPAGEAAKDSSPGGREGKVHGAAAVAGVRGGALEFDGKDDYVALGDLGTHEAVTVAFWMKRDGTARADDIQGLVTSDGWEEGMPHVAVQAGAVDVYLHLGKRRRGRVQGPRLAGGTWHHVAVTADRRLGVMRLFVNGAEEDQADISGLPCPIKLAAQVVGREFDGKGPGRYFRGAIDDVRIYGRALDEEEIRPLCPERVGKLMRDPRNIRTGRRIPDEDYCDQPYVVVTKDGNWLCTLTTGPFGESEPRQHVVATISTDRGRTWSPLIDIEPPGEIQSSWVVPLVVRSGRVYGFYNYNGEQIHTLDGKEIKGDELGWYVFKYSDDCGKSWSKDRYRLPMRVTACDRNNAWHGKVQMFWGIDKPQVVGPSVMFAFSKLGKYQEQLGEGWCFRSDNILTEHDVSKLRWELLPDGDHGVRAEEFGSVQEEHNLAPLSNGALYCAYRTTRGHPCHAYSADGGRTWTKPEFMTYTPGGRKVKHPRACPMLWRTAAGKFLFWFHNNANPSYRSRNPVWITGGIEKGGRIHWAQPEILLYDPDLCIGISYPDLIEQDGCYWVTETQKSIARVHSIDKALLEGLWSQGQVKKVSPDGLLVEFGADKLRTGEARLPRPLNLAAAAGDVNSLSKEEIAEGWILLFDGSTTFGWEAQGGAKWKVVDGALVSGEGTGWILTTTEFTDFTLKAEFRVGEGGNSGIAFRAAVATAWPSSSSSWRHTLSGTFKMSTGGDSCATKSSVG